VHEPGHEVGAIAAKVVEGAGAVLGRVSEPLEKFRLNPDFFRPLVAIVDHHLANLAKRFSRSRSKTARLLEYQVVS